MPRRIERFRAIFETLGQPARGSILSGVPLKYQRSPLSAIGSIYFANDGDTVLRETRIVKYTAGGTPITVPTRAHVVIALHYDVSYLVDLTDPAVQEALAPARRQDADKRGEPRVNAGIIGARLEARPPESRTAGLRGLEFRTGAFSKAKGRTPA